MFHKNPATKQNSLADPYHGLLQCVKVVLHNSWAEYFFHFIFAKIKEDRFNPLYSDNHNQPNIPVNILIGLLILKKLNRWTDEELIGALYFDYRVSMLLALPSSKKKGCALTPSAVLDKSFTNIPLYPALISCTERSAN